MSDHPLTGSRGEYVPPEPKYGQGGNLNKEEEERIQRERDAALVTAGQLREELKKMGRPAWVEYIIYACAGLALLGLSLGLLAVMNRSEKTETQLGETKAALTQTQNDTAAARTQLDQTKAELSATETKAKAQDERLERYGQLLQQVTEKQSNSAQTKSGSDVPPVVTPPKSEPKADPKPLVTPKGSPNDVFKPEMKINEKYPSKEPLLTIPVPVSGGLPAGLTPYQQGKWYVVEKKYDEAIKVLTEVINTSSGIEKGLALSERSKAYRGKGMMTEAKADRDAGIQILESQK